MNLSKIAKLCIAVMVTAITVIQCGCANGPFDSVAEWNPLLRMELQEDQQFGPTWYQKLNELHTLRENASRMSSVEQERWSQQLAAMLSNPVNSVQRPDIILTLGAFKTPTAVAILRQAVNDPDAQMRMAACRAWATYGGSEAVQSLSWVVGSDTDQDVRAAALRELAQFKGEPAAIQALGLALDDSDPALQYRAVQSLKSVSGRDYGDNVPAWKQYVQGGNPNVPEVSVAEKVREWLPF
ncbi:MAG: HEAT repeat domain-containing protein [Pirellulaceae bacterium]|nr:HEAT repeat domain-containing protein [Pirellulaceae bacterium]